MTTCSVAQTLSLVTVTDDNYQKEMQAGLLATEQGVHGDKKE